VGLPTKPSWSRLVDSTPPTRRAPRSRPRPCPCRCIRRTTAGPRPSTRTNGPLTRAMSRGPAHQAV